MDTRLQHLIRRETEARADVRRYAARKWPVGSRITYTLRGTRIAGTVTGYDAAAHAVAVVGDDKSKRRIPYSLITERKRKS